MNFHEKQDNKLTLSIHGVETTECKALVVLLHHDVSVATSFCARLVDTSAYCLFKLADCEPATFLSVLSQLYVTHAVRSCGNILIVLLYGVRLTFARDYVCLEVKVKSEGLPSLKFILF